MERQEQAQIVENEISQEWKEMVDRGIDELLESYEIFGQLNFSPILFSEGEDERSFPELNPEEQTYIYERVVQQLGVNFNPENIITTYPLVQQDPESVEIKNEWEGISGVTVYKTDRSEDEDMYFHSIYYPDGVKDFVVAPSDYRFEPETSDDSEGGEDEL